MAADRRERIVVLTGAGISAESGLATFRDPDGLWARQRLEEVATPEAFRRDPVRVLEFYNARRAGLLAARPNEAHHALVALEAGWPGRMLLVTQNVDHLHELAGSRALVHMHGELLRTRCEACGFSRPDEAPIALTDACGQCGREGVLRPDVVWFGEMPHHMDEIEQALGRADLFIAIGTSGEVYPAAGFVRFAGAVGARKVLLNLDPTGADGLFDERRHGKASEIVPAFVNELLAGA